MHIMPSATLLFMHIMPSAIGERYIVILVADLLSALVSVSRIIQKVLESTFRNN